MMRPLAVGEQFEVFESNEEYSWSQGDASICSKPIISYNDFCSNGEMMELEEEEEEEKKAASLIAAAASFIMKPTKAPSPDSVLDLQDTPPLDADRTYRSQFGWLVSSPNMVAHAGYMMVGDHYVAASHDDQYAMDDIVQTFYDCTAYNPRYASSPPSPLQLQYGSLCEGEMPSTDEEPRSSSDPDTTSFSSLEDHYTTSYEIKDYEMKSDQLNQFVEAKKPKKQVSPKPIVAFRRSIKAYLDKQLQEELQASCMYQNEGEIISFCIPELDHHHHRDCCLQIDPISAWMLQERDSRNDHGLQLVHHLFACAEAVACRDVRHARSHLRRVRELASPYGNPLQRVAACFVEGLAARLEHITVSPATAPPIFAAAAHELEVNNDMLRQEAFYLMYEVCPFVRFGHLIANSIILEAVEGEEAVHVIDLGMAEGLQWPSLIYSLANRPGGPPKLLRITGIGAYKSRMEEIGEALRLEAAAVALNFEFQAVEQPLESVVAADVGLRDGEALAVNSVLKLHCVVKESRGSLNTVLQAIHRLSPKVLTLAEQDANHNGPFFLGRFTEALNYYSAIFDSLQVALPRFSTRRVKIEQFHLAPEIRNIVACEGPTRVERHERVDQWRRRMSRAGFQPTPVRLAAQARIWLANFYPADIDNYTLSDEKGCLVLGWKGKPIIAASAWRC